MLRIVMLATILVAGCEVDYISVHPDSGLFGAEGQECPGDASAASPCVFPDWRGDWPGWCFRSHPGPFYCFRACDESVPGRPTCPYQLKPVPYGGTDKCLCVD